MKTAQKFLQALLFAGSLMTVVSAQAQTIDADSQTSSEHPSDITQVATVTPADQPVVVAPQQGWWSQWWTGAKKKADKILDEGQLEMDLSGWARHGRGTYTPEKLRELNEKAWGIGFNKVIRDEKDNEEMLFGMLISDSHYKPQPMAGYVYQWMKPLGDKIEVGAGYTALMISRTDYFKGVPFPVVLPVASIGTRGAKLMAAYVPRLSKNKGNGDVLLMFVRFDLN